MPRWTRLLAVVLAVACTACELELGLGMEFHRDGSGVLSVSLGADRELLDEATAAGAMPLDELAEAGAGLDGWTVDDQDTQQGRVVTLRTSFGDPAQFGEVTAQLAGALSAEEVELLSPLQLSLDESELRLRGRASLQPTAAVSDIGLSRRQVVRRLRRADAVRYTISATFPGPVVAAPSASVQGNTATWSLRPGDAVDLDAVAQRPPAPLLRIVAAGVAGGLAAGLVLWLWARRRRAANR